MPSTPTEALLDVNIVIASIFADHVSHMLARQFVETLDRFYTTPTTQGGFSASPRGHGRMSLERYNLHVSRWEKARRSCVSFQKTQGHIFLPDDSPFTELGLRSMQGHRQWTDAYLLHLARKHGLWMASLESRMANLDDPARPSLFVLTKL